MEQHFIFKIKSQYLPKFITEYERNGKFKSSGVINTIDIKFFRKLKIQKIENDISEEDKKFLDYLLNDDFVDLLTEEEYNNLTAKYSGARGSSGTSGTYGMSGISGT